MDDLAASFMKKSAPPAAPAEDGERPSAARSTTVSMMAQDDEEWKAPSIFSAQNAAPFAVLIIIGTFQALLPFRDSLPVWVQALIPVVLGRQAAPPGYVPPDWFFWY